MKKRMETYCRQHLHGTETLRRNKRGETVKLTEEEMEKSTHQQDGIDDSGECGEESEEEQPKRKKKGTFRKDKQDVAHQTALCERLLCVKLLL
jgi:hypothetical protein